jgi:cobalt transporter subunit CbtA
MINRMVLPALLAGTMAAILLSIIQVFWITPLIFEAETYEVSAPLMASEHRHVAAAWQPKDGWQRTVFTVGSNVVMAFGFSLMLIGFYSLFKTSKIYQGLAWGAAGYVAFFASPALGLPPELPGTVAANLVDRQTWFIGTVFSSAIGLMLMFIPKTWILRLVGVLWVLLPHFIGAPLPEMHESLVPHLLITQFIWAATVSNAVFWLILGALSLTLFRFFSPIQKIA